MIFVRVHRLFKLAKLINTAVRCNPKLSVSTIRKRNCISFNNLFSISLSNAADLAPEQQATQEYSIIVFTCKCKRTSFWQFPLLFFTSYYFIFFLIIIAGKYLILQLQGGNIWMTFIFIRSVNMVLICLTSLRWGEAPSILSAKPILKENSARYFFDSIIFCAKFH